MSERAYTVKELDALRGALCQKLTYGTTAPFRQGETCRYGHSPDAKTLEERVRTAMIAGHIAEDIYAADRA